MVQANTTSSARSAQQQSPQPQPDRSPGPGLVAPAMLKAFAALSVHVAVPRVLVIGSIGPRVTLHQVFKVTRVTSSVELWAKFEAALR